jgi:hypothetical protein
MFKTFTVFCKFFKSLILLILWICNFCEFMSYLPFWLYYGCMNFPYELQPQGQGKELTRKLEFHDKCTILLGMEFSGVGINRKCQFI